MKKNQTLLSFQLSSFTVEKGRFEGNVNCRWSYLWQCNGNDCLPHLEIEKVESTRHNSVFRAQLKSELKLEADRSPARLRTPFVSENHGSGTVPLFVYF